MMDFYPEFCRKRILILGCGNLLLGDDGFGPLVIDHLLRHYEVPEDVYVMDVGTGVRKILFTVALSDVRPDEIVIVDAMSCGKEPGEVFELPIESIPMQKVDDFSMHQAPTSNLLRELRDYAGLQVTVLACDVGSVEQKVHTGLSAAAKKAVPQIGHMIAEKYLS